MPKKTILRNSPKKFVNCIEVNVNKFDNFLNDFTKSSKAISKFLKISCKEKRNSLTVNTSCNLLVIRTAINLLYMNILAVILN